MSAEHLFETTAHEHAISYDELAVYDRVSGTGRPTTQPGLDWIGQCACKLRPVQRPHRNITYSTHLKDADLAFAAEATGATERCNFERHPSRTRIGTVAQFGEQHRLAGFEPERS